MFELNCFFDNRFKYIERCMKVESDNKVLLKKMMEIDNGQPPEYLGKSFKMHQIRSSANFIR